MSYWPIIVSSVVTFCSSLGVQYLMTRRKESQDAQALVLAEVKQSTVDELKLQELCDKFEEMNVKVERAYDGMIAARREIKYLQGRINGKGWRTGEA